METKLNISTGYKKSTNIQTKWLMISEEVRISIISKLEIAVKHHSHSLSGEQRTSVISRLELQQGTTATHKLESQGQEWSAG